MDFYRGKNVLVTGGSGMIGQALCPMLVELGANVTVASLDDQSRSPLNTSFQRLDLRSFENCLSVASGKDIVFHLAGVKGSPRMTAERPASFFVPTLQFSLNMMEASRRCGVSNYLLTSSIGVYQPADTFREDDVWHSFPSPNDRFAGWAKRMCELQSEAYSIEYGFNSVSIVRPANVFGPFDNFDPANAMVIPSLIHKAATCPGPLSVWGDGSSIRDFIYADDVARGMLKAVELGINIPLNLGSGDGITIKSIAEIIADRFNKSILWDVDKPSGDRRRVMDVSRAASFGIKSRVSLSEAINKTIDWYLHSSLDASSRYNSFTEPDLRPSVN